MLYILSFYLSLKGYLEYPSVADMKEIKQIIVFYSFISPSA